MTRPEVRLTLNTREDYQLVVVTTGDITSATINANTFFGARHALETLTQLIEYQVMQDSCMPYMGIGYWCSYITVVT